MKIPDYPKSVVIEEQGLRDGLQDEDKVVPTAKKLEIINAMIRAGMRDEVLSSSSMWYCISPAAGHEPVQTPH